MAVQESSISRRIRDLEDQLGASLFHRHNGGVCLTLAGQHFLRQARAAMQHLGQGAKDVGAVGRCESGHLRIGVLSTLASGFLSDLFQAYEAQRPGVRIDFTDGRPAEHISAARLHQLDIAFVAGKVKHVGCETMHLWSEQVFAVLPAGHSLAERHALAWQDLINETFVVGEQAPSREVHDFLVKRLSDLGRYVEIHRQDVGRDNLMSLVAIGRGLTLTSEATTATSFAGVAYRPIAGETLPFSAVWSPKNDNPALRRLLSMARALSKTFESSNISVSSPIPSTVEPSRTRDRSS